MKPERINVVGAQIPYPLQQDAELIARLQRAGLNPSAFRATVPAPALVLTEEIEQSETKELFRFTPTKKEMNALRSHRLKFPIKGRFIELHAELCQKYDKQLYSCFSTDLEGDEVVVYALLLDPC